MNARYLEYLGFGRFAHDLENASVIHRFIDAIPECKKKLASYEQDGNNDLLGAVDTHLDRAAAGLY
jgi:hypothetical protein